MNKKRLNKIAENLMRESVKETRKKAKEFLRLFDLGADEGDNIEDMLKKVTRAMKKSSAREAIQKAIKYSDRVELTPEEENYIIEQLEKYLE